MVGFGPAQLWPTVNDNSLSPSLSSLVACLLCGYPINTGRIIGTRMRDRALNERETFPFLCLIGKLCRQAEIPPNWLVDRWNEASRLIQVSKIKKYIGNLLFGANSAAINHLHMAPPVHLELSQTDRVPD